MKNTLKIALMLIGIGMIGYGTYALIFGKSPNGVAQQGLVSGGDYTQALAMMAFGALCLISGIAFRRR